MTENAETNDELPTVIPIFPLAGAILMPRSNMPLNIFEPRYLQMIKDARAADGYIGMVQPRDDKDETAKPDLFQVGGVGRITHYTETEDGRNVIRLTGVCRFMVKSELSVMTPYRQVQPEWSFAGTDLVEPTHSMPVDREPLMAALKVYLTLKQLDADYDGINTAPDEVLINTLSMIMPFGTAEKQALLEAVTLHDRVETLVSLLSMAASATNCDVTTILS
ncbi:MAG: LON peptidase substrate-binding domain-containing protein [Kordiimonadaceae bacterium]|nr:LON peptidase substrate-binding domain-containing protein [Kordiimonadaceae bacterium]